MSDLLTPKELAAELKVSLAWVRKYTAQLPRVKFGKCVRFSKSEIAVWLEEQREQPQKRRNGGGAGND